MASTRFRDDHARIEDQLRQSTFECGYMINAPGTGTSPAFAADPYIRSQKWGANLMTNSVDLESELKGIRPISKDCHGKDEYTNYHVNTSSIQYPTNSELYTDQSRAIAPAWELRDKEALEHGTPLHFNPQDNVEPQFNSNISTRILEKDHFHPNSLHITKGPEHIQWLPHHFPGSTSR